MGSLITEVDATSEDLKKELNWIIFNEKKSDYGKVRNKFLENPFVPIGILLTTAALTCGLIDFYKGDGRKQQLMMKCRVAAQGFTVAAMFIGLAIKDYRNRNN